jgi:FtsP/CotA-like multicopper oxidase with cupredoxin domain/fibronectin type 3 domain-containing protein
MTKYKVMNIVVSLMVLTTTLFGYNTRADAMPMDPMDESKVPHYFGPYPNWANSPLTMPDVQVVITGNGTGATAEATVGANGAITGVTITDPGSGYSNAKVDFVSTNGTGASADVTIVKKGSVVAVTVNSPGTGYTAPVVTFSGNGGAAATAYGGVEAVFLANGGSGYTMPTVEFDLPDGPDGVQAKGHAVMDANGTITAVIVDSPGSGYSFAPGVAIHNGTLFDPIAGATLAQASTTLSIQSIGLDAFGAGYNQAPTVTISDPTGTGATATAVLDNGIISAITLKKPGSGYLTPGMRKFVDTLPGLTEAGVNNLGQYLPVAVPDTTTFPGTDYYEIALVQHSEQMHSDLPPTLLREYVQISTSVVPGKGVALYNDMLDGSQQLIAGHTGVDDPHFLGPVIIAQKDRAVRITFYNLLPTGADGDLFLPVDSTFMGSGMGPDSMMDGYDPTPTTGGSVMDMVRNPMCDQYPKPADCFKDNRATLHLHGGITPWISDGTPHQWITPANENTPYPQGVSVGNVPDMVGQAAIDAGVPDCSAPDDGCSTFYYTNQQSARLMFYHDHAWGITRLNVYAGEAAGYLIQDPVEQALVANGTIPADQIPLVIQDRTFVPDAAQLALQDPTWDPARWGTKGNFWYQHVYMPAQNPNDPSGMSAYGRWMYGAWFWPPQTDLKYGPIDNPYYNPACDLNDPATWQYDTDPFCEPPQIPGTTLLSAGMEQFNDTPIVNGTAYPTITLEPKSYRLRILNAANDRFWNLQWYVGDQTTASTDVNGLGEVIGATEVALKANEVAAAQLDPAGIFPTPDLNLSPAGPDWIQIGTEGGFLPKPVVVDGQQVTTWITDPTRFDVGNVDQHSLLVAPAERADVIVDFSKFAGQTLILYNDAPAAFPARVPSYDYFTGYPDQWPNGPSMILPGYGPNTRTIMQVKIAGTAAPAFNLNALNNAFLHKADGSGVFESGQHPIIVGQAAYNSAYGTNFAANGNCTDLTATNKCDGYLRIDQYGNQPLRFDSLLMGSTGYQQPKVMIEPKAIHDEMNSTTFDPWGRMTANLGIEATPPTPGLTNFNPMPYVYPSNAIIDATNLPKNDPDNPDFKITPIASNDDGTQIWRITHNGVDTHPIHFHLYDVQLLNRVTWDNIIIPPDPNELGWKDTIRVSPLEDTTVALRPIIPKLPWEIPNSVRALSPMDPLFDGVDPLNPQIGDHGVLASATLADLGGIGIPPSNGQGEPVDIVNHLVNFGWEYVFHCHILSHEEMDMMQPVSVAMPPVAPSGLTFTDNGDGTATLAWNDNSVAETAYVVQISTDGANWTDVDRIDIPLTPGPNSTGAMSYVLSAWAMGDQYRVVAENTVGDTFNYANPGVNEITAPDTGFPHVTATSSSEVVIVGEPAPAAPTNLTATLDDTVPQVTLAWTDNATNETSYDVYRSDNGGAFAVIDTLPADSVIYADTTVASGNHYEYQVAAVNAGGSSYSNIVAVDWTGAAPAAPTNLAATVLSATQVQLDWTDNAINETGYIVERSDDGGATFAVVATLGADTVTYIDGTVGAGNSYIYQVAATNNAGQSGYSNQATVDVLLPAAPLNLSATNVSRTGFTFNWEYPFPQPDGFEIQISSNGNFNTIEQLFPDVAADSTSLVISGLTRNTRYYVRIRAFNAVGVGPWSQTLQLKTSK